MGKDKNNILMIKEIMFYEKYLKRINYLVRKIHYLQQV